MPSTRPTVWPWTLVGAGVGLALALLVLLLVAGGARAEHVVYASTGCTFPVSWVLWQTLDVTSANWHVPIAGCWVVYFACVGTLVGLVADWGGWRRPATTAALAVACLLAPAISFALALLLA